MAILLGVSLFAARAGAADEGTTGRVFELAPLTVSEPTDGPPWQYVAAPGFEVLSRCSDASTIHLVEEMNRLQQWLKVMLPTEFQARRDVPTIVVAYNERTKPVVSQEVVAELMRDDHGPAGAGDSKEVRYRSLPNLRLSDMDSAGFFFIITEKDFPRSKLELTPDYIRYVIRNRTPAPPAWFADGMADLYAQGNFDTSPVVFAPLGWLSDAETAKIAKNPEYPRALLPLQALFAPAPVAAVAPDQSPEPDAALRRAEGVLFLRWALAGGDAARREALWRFVERASTGPVTEAAFQECFGMGYVDVQERISDYLSDRVGRSFKLTPQDGPELPALRPRNATELEIGRIKGDWERMEINYVNARYPKLTAKYVEQARRTLSRAAAKAPHDPRLEAVMGLCECDAGNDAGARPLLEAAAAAGVVRPRVYYELARLRYLAAKAAPALPEGRLSAAQASEVLRPLTAAHRQLPPLIETYALAADVWSRSAVPLSRRNLDVLDEGVAYFPWNEPLTYRVAWLNARDGFKAQAEALIARGLGAAPPPPVQAQFEQLRASLASSQPATPAP